MMVLGPKHVGAIFSVLMCKFYISALVGIIIEWKLTNNEVWQIE